MFHYHESATDVRDFRLGGVKITPVCCERIDLFISMRKEKEIQNAL